MTGIPETIQRAGQLTVILHADIVGSTALVQRDADLAHKRIQEAFRQFALVIQQYHGSISELRGDALLAEFNRASDATIAALAFQIRHSEYCDGLTDSIVPRVRVGIAMGEVVIADSTLTGAGVVLAQRLEQLADPGHVVIQSAARETVPQRLPIAFEYIGECELKGFDQAVRAFRATVKAEGSLPVPVDLKPKKKRSAVLPYVLSAVLVAAGGFSIAYFSGMLSPEISSERSERAEQSEKPSLAVLPFHNLSGDEEQDYFTDGIADDLITDLAQVSGLFVTARSSSFDYRDENRDFLAIAEDLGVRYLLEGSVRRASSQVRINARLIDSTTGQRVWSQRYDRRIENIFEMQDEVTADIVSQLSVSLTSSEKRQLASPAGTNIDAYEFFLKGLERVSRFNPTDNATGREYFEKSVQLDPGYARAYAGIGLSHGYDSLFSWVADRQASIDAGLAASKRAMQINDNLPHAHIAFATSAQLNGDYEDAMYHARRATDLAPNYADGHAQYAAISSTIGKHEQSLVSIARAKQLNPHYTYIYLYVEALALFHLDRYEDALVAISESVERNPEFDRMQLLLAATLGHLGRIEDAEWALEEAAILRPDLDLEDERANHPYSEVEDVERYISGLKKAGL